MEKYFTTGISMFQATERTSITHILLQKIHHQNYRITRGIYGKLLRELPWAPGRRIQIIYRIDLNRIYLYYICIYDLRKKRRNTTHM
jgi:hypothetical protein